MAVVVDPDTGLSGSFFWGPDGDPEIDSVNGTPVTTPSWTITLTGEGTFDFSAADGGGDAGDVFSLYIDGVYVPWTAVSYPGGYFSGQLNDHLLTAGEHTITLVVGGPNPEGSNTSFSISAVTYLNVAPVAVDDQVTVGENGLVSADVLANDTDGDEDTLQLTSVGIATGYGTAQIVDGQVQFNPGDNYDYLADGESADVVINYTISDGNGGTDTGQLTVTVEGENDGPVAVADDAGSIDEDDAVLIDVLANDTDVDASDVLSISSAAVISGLGTATVVDGEVRYDTAGDYNYLAVGESETITLSYVVSDGNGGTATETVTVLVSGENDGPSASSDSATTDEDNSILIDILANDTDPDTSDDLTITNLNLTGLGTTYVSEGRLFYDPEEEYASLGSGESATVTIEYVISDGNGGTATATATITVTGVNDAPDAVSDVNSAVEDSSTTGNVVTNDSDVEGDTLAVTSVSHGDITVSAGAAVQGLYGTLTLNSDGTYTYAADADYLDTLSNVSGLSETFSYVLSDGNGGTDTATLTISVSLADDERSQSGTRNRDRLSGDQNGLVGAEDTIYGLVGNDVIMGHEGSDKLYGGGDADQLFGGAGIDFLYGEDGRDTLFGDDGNDTLDGGRADDQLTGGAGSDIFVFGKSNSQDVITDFVVGEDKILFADNRINSSTLGDFNGDGLTDLKLATMGGSVLLLGVSEHLGAESFVV